MRRIYMDNAATTALYPEVAEETASLMKSVYGNPSSLHAEGTEAKKILNRARSMIAESIGCSSGEIYFTSGGSEADNWAIIGTLKKLYSAGKKHVVTTNIEHPAVFNTLVKNNIDTTSVPVNGEGYIGSSDIKTALRDDTALVTVMYANNEIGTIQPIKEIAEICKKHGVPFHTDAVQAAGHIAINVKEIGCDMLSLSAHKFHGPKGIGALYIKDGINLPGMIVGGGQEHSGRAGTENFIAAYSMALALKKSLENIDEKNKKTAAVRDKLIEGISQIEGARINGGKDRLPGNVSACFNGIDGEALMLLLDLKGIAASSGSACSSGLLKISHVLSALGLPYDTARGSLRLSLCEYNTHEEADYVLGALREAVIKLREL
ncbi:MAG: cysteine desulfurase family protein [Eubacteriales bacterium]|nr:cysteine desulfurase family protein [Eubacteriales bacterium]